MQSEAPTVAKGASLRGRSDAGSSPRPLSRMANGEDMTEETVHEEQPIKSAVDLDIERLSARLDALENENRELRSANQGLWAQLHPTVAEAMPEPVREDVAFKTLADKLGISEE